ncbi:hypothetical protein QVD17_37933 [Tagetes erecta]|uniref:Uncharacterized protein n=1 Tax=Tagetes erecta TaxID=13708 RepID=A0AAD8K1H0_TARER|nr:hypothetical protein QVD17_37933 [Tagetes erecta]
MTPDLRLTVMMFPHPHLHKKVLSELDRGMEQRERDEGVGSFDDEDYGVPQRRTQEKIAWKAVPDFTKGCIENGGAH